MADWAFLTNHGRVLLCIAESSGSRLRDIADRVGLAERATAEIVRELCEAGYLSKHKLGRRNFYEVHPDLPLRGTLEAEHQVGDLLAPLLAGTREKQRTSNAA